MKEVFTSLIFILLIDSVIPAQSTIIIYESKPNIEYQLRNETRSEVRERISKHLLSNIKNYKLINSKGVSIYKEYPSDSASVKNDMVISEADKNVYFKDKNENLFFRETSLIGKNYLISDSLPKYKWKISNDQKDILGYKCLKATTCVDGQTIVAWITDKVPINDGPIEYWINNALILKLTTNNFTIIAKEIVSFSETLEVEKPKKGKVIKRQAFVDKIKNYKNDLLFNQIMKN